MATVRNNIRYNLFSSGVSNLSYISVNPGLGSVRACHRDVDVSSMGEA